jgi:signal recognition particle subunit SRP68
LLLKLNQFPRPDSLEEGTLVGYPPTLHAIPVKPFFYDIAYNYIGAETAGEQTPAAAAEEEKPPEPVKRGWFWR